MQKALERQTLDLLGDRFYPYARNRWRRYPSTLVWQYALCYLKQACFPNTKYMDKALSTAWKLLIDAPHILFGRVCRLLRQLQQFLRPTKTANPSGGDALPTQVTDDQLSAAAWKKKNRGTC